jgi:hypothetical protein
MAYGPRPGSAKAASRSGRRWSAGTRKGMPASLIFRFARESRRFIVSLGTRNARAILGAQPAERAQGQGDLRLGAECGVAEGEDQLQPLVGKGRLLHLVLHGFGHVEQARLFRERVVAAQPVERAVARGDREPGARTGRRAVAGPALGGGREGLLSGLLGEVEIAEKSDQAGEDAAPLVAEDLLEQRLPLHQGTHLDGAAHTRGRNPRGDLERRVEIVDVDQVVAAEVFLRLDKRTVGEKRLSVFNADGGRGLDWVQLLTADDGRRLPDREVLADDRVLLILRQPLEFADRAARVDLE